MATETPNLYEEVSRAAGYSTRRLAVPGGWIYITFSYFNGHETMSQTFVPDPQKI